MRGEAERLFQVALDAARACGVTDLEVVFSGENSSLTRFANNAIHQNVAESSAHISIRPIIHGRTARASTNRRDEAAIRAAVQEAIKITCLLEPNPELLPLAEPAPFEQVERYFDATAHVTPAERAATVAEAIAEVQNLHQKAAGMYSTGDTFFCVMNSSGLSASHSETMARFSITAMDRDSSGWATASACDHRTLNPAALARSAARKAASSQVPRELSPGRYTVVLEPAAVLDLVGQMFVDFSATAIRDGRSFLNDRLGKQLFAANLTIHDNARHPQQSGAPFDQEGVPRRPLTLVENGVIRDVAYSRQAAASAAVAPTGHGLLLPNETGEFPANIVIAGGDHSLEDMIASTARGILVTRFWYIREVDPYKKIFTGMTRDGTFLVENGGITTSVRNFRFNQSLIEMLSNVETMSPSERSSGEESFDLVAPAMKVRDFNFTEVTRF